MTNPALLTLTNLSVRTKHQTLIRDINLTLNQREILTIIGPNGAGKSTLLKVMAGLIPASSGRIERASTLRLGYLPQKLSVDRSMPIKVSRFLSLNSRSKVEYRAALERVGALSTWSKQLNALSGGEFQRVLLARAIAVKPGLLLLDEPLQGVDVIGQTALYQLIASLRDELHCAVVMVSHDLHLVMAKTDQVVCLNQHICCAGQPESISEHPEYLKLFGRQAAEDVAIYAHHHDHHHSLHGGVEHCQSGCRHD